LLVPFPNFATNESLNWKRNQVALDGGQATFEVEVLGKAPFKFQWFKDNVRIPNATDVQ
jgi:hypothetical protein